MGVVVQFRCGAYRYRTKELYLGEGGSGPGDRLLDLVSAPAARSPEPRFEKVGSCPSCRTVRALGPSQLATGCRAHRRPYRVYEDDEWNQIPCPKCGITLGIENLGLWD